MTSNTEANNEKVGSEVDRESQKIQPKTNFEAEQMQVQVARKESSSGFMLLSVKHLSNVKSVANTNGKAMDALEESYDDNCLQKAASLQMNCRGGKGTSLELGRHYSSTISLEAEEYDNDDEEETDSRSESHLIQPNVPVEFQQPSLVMRNPPSSYNPTRVRLFPFFVFKLRQRCHIAFTISFSDCKYGMPH